VRQEIAKLQSEDAGLSRWLSKFSTLIFNRIHHMATPHSGVRASPAATLAAKMAEVRSLRNGALRVPAAMQKALRCTPNTRRVAGLSLG